MVVASALPFHSRVSRVASREYAGCAQGLTAARRRRRREEEEGGRRKGGEEEEEGLFKADAVN